MVRDPRRPFPCDGADGRAASSVLLLFILEPEILGSVDEVRLPELKVFEVGSKETLGWSVKKEGASDFRSEPITAY